MVLGNQEQVFIVVHESDRPMALLVDRVSDVLAISADVIEPAPSFGNDGPNRLVLGLAKTEGRVRVLLDMHRLLDVGDEALAA